MSVSSGTGSLGWSRTKGRKTVVVVLDVYLLRCLWITFQIEPFHASFYGHHLCHFALR